MSESGEKSEKRGEGAEPQHNLYSDTGFGADDADGAGSDNTADNTSEHSSNLTPPPAGVGTPYHSTTGAESGSGPHYAPRGGYQMPPPGGQYANYGYYPPQIQWHWHNGRWYNTPQAEDGTWLVKEDRTMAMLAHLLTLFSGFVGPLIIYLVKKDDSKFTAFHALQALYFEIMIIIVNVTLVILGYGIMFAAISTVGPQPGLIAVFLLPFFLLFPINIGALIYKIVLCVKSSKGEWARYPIVGMWAFNRVEMRYSQQRGY